MELQALQMVTRTSWATATEVLKGFQVRLENYETRGWRALNWKKEDYVKKKKKKFKPPYDSVALFP